MQAYRHLQDGLPKRDPAELKAAIANAEIAIKTAAYKYVAALGRYMRGSALCGLYEVEGQLALMTLGVSDLRTAFQVVRNHGSRSLRSMVGINLAVALVRSGEQQGDIKLLREGVELSDMFLGDARDEDFSVLVNAKAVAQLRIGVYGGDSDLVIAAVRELQAHSTVASISSSARAQTLQNLCAALTANARQQRNSRVYREVLAWLAERSQRIQDQLSAFFTHYRAQVSIELFALDGELGVAEDALRMLTELIQWHRNNPFRRLEALHSLAQAHFQIGKRQQAEVHFQKSIDAVREALQLADESTVALDSRRHRLLADLAAYLFALGQATGRRELTQEANAQYESALKLLSPAKAPAVFASVARGHFYLQFQQQEWTAALKTFTKLEEVWDRIAADPTLSHTVHQQSARELDGQHTRAAWASLAVGATDEAFLTLDRGRARLLQMALDVPRHDAELLNSNDSTRLAVARDAVYKAQASISDRDCELAWDRYLNLRRQLGLDGALERLTLLDTQARIPAGGAVVQILLSAVGSAALLLTSDAHGVEVVALAADAVRRLDTILTPPPPNASLTSAYRAFVEEDPASQDGSKPSGARLWADALERARTILGIEVFDPVNSALLRAGLKPGAQVILCLPGPLARLPAAAAILSDGTYFGERWSTSIAPRLSALREPQPPKAVQQRLLVISPPHDAIDGFEALRFAAREASLVGNGLKKDVRVAIDEQHWEVPDLLKAMQSASIVHAACHGVYDWSDPDSSGLMLGHGRKLTTRRLRTENKALPDLRLIVLSSCESGLTGVDDLANEFRGLPLAILQAGGRAIIGALWPVFDDVAMVLMDRFYRLYLDDSGYEITSPAEALAAAQRWVRSATIRDLIAHGYFTAVEASAIAAARDARHVRLRTLRSVAGMSSHSCDDAARSKKDALIQTLDEKPYAAPSEWAAFVLFGT